MDRKIQDTRAKRNETNKREGERKRKKNNNMQMSSQKGTATVYS